MKKALLASGAVAVTVTALILITALLFSIRPDDFNSNDLKTTNEEAVEKSWRAGPEAQTYLVTNQTSGSDLFVRVLYPEGRTDDKTLRPLVLVPGGSSDSRDFLKQKTARFLADAGYMVVLFDPEGRGQSEGEEDYNGFIGQDGLAEVIRLAWDIQESPVTLITFSFGVTLGSGVLARYPDLPVSGLIDWEGPADRNDTGGCDEYKTGHMAEVATCFDEAFWEEREALNFIGKLQVFYIRLQTEKDHVQPDVLSAVRMVNVAAAGTSLRVQLNDEWIKFLGGPGMESIYKILSEEDPPRMLPNSIDGSLIKMLPDYIESLFAG